MTFYTGLVTSATDADNGVTNAAEYDDLGRPVKGISAQGTSLESWTTTTYYDTARYVVVKSDLETKGDGKRVATQFYDQLGRVRLSKTLEDAATQSATNETDGIKVETRYQTGNPNSYQLTSNPFRAATATAATNEPTMGWTLSTALNTGRHSEVETFSGTGLPGPWGTNTATTGKVQTDIDANATTVTDQAGKQRRSITNALGQLTRVDEPNGTGQLGSITAPNQPTYYSYNTLGKMVRVQQGVQNRYFMYDSLGRTLRVRQPEQEVNTVLNTSGNPDNNSWSGGFTYDNNGNPLTTTDAKGTTITSTFDALNRPLTRTYSDGTPTVTNYYDGAGLPSVPQFSKGKLTKVSNSISESSYTSFDVAGRLLSSEQRTPLDGETISQATPRVSGYLYNLSGALIQETYPSGRVVKNEFETDGDLARIYGKPTSTATEQTYATSFSYTADGKIEKLKLGNGLWESAKLNTRSQVTELAVGHSIGDGSLLKINYDYGELGADGVSVDSTKNAGNIAKQTVNFSGLANAFVQTYKYDSLDRIKEAVEKVNGSQSWRQTFGYDKYGNRTSFYQIVGSQELPMNNLTLPTVEATTNRFSINQGYSYDKNGNVTNDPASSGRTFIFNGDNKQTEVQNSSNYTIGRYYYDGEGKRVKKVTDTETTVFVYSNGKLIAEYSTATPPPNPTINYTATDQLGSPRILTDKFGQVVSRRDFMPFGEELYADGQNRTTSGKYSLSGQDSVRQRFTGYQKDMETGLDFAEARYYNNQHARFTAVDPLVASGKSANPQTFNRYVYCLNNPLILTDPTGMQVGKWYEPVNENGNAVRGNYTYIFNGGSTSGYRELSTRNRAGELIGSGEALDSNHVYRFNPNGPEPPNVASIVLSQVLSDYEYQGYDVIATDAYEASSIEHPADGYARGSEMAITPLDIGLLGMGGGVGAVGKEAMEGAITVGSREAVTALAETPRSILMPGGEMIGNAGSKAAYRELSGGTQAADSFMNRLISTGAKPKFQLTYPGRAYTPNQGGFFGYRTEMSSKSAGTAVTIDVDIFGIEVKKLKFK